MVTPKKNNNHAYKFLTRLLWVGKERGQSSTKDCSKVSIYHLNTRYCPTLLERL